MKGQFGHVLMCGQMCLFVGVCVIVCVCIYIYIYIYILLISKNQY